MGILKDTYIVKNNTNIDTKPIADAIIKSNREKNEIEKEEIASRDRANITAQEYKELVIENYKLEQEKEKLKESEKYYRRDRDLYEDFLWEICRRLDRMCPTLLIENTRILSVNKRDGDTVIDVRLECK